MRSYDGLGLDAFVGHALFVGPTLYVRLARKLFMTAAWNVQVAGREFADDGTLNLNEFTRQRAKLKFAYEF